MARDTAPSDGHVPPLGGGSREAIPVGFSEDRESAVLGPLGAPQLAGGGGQGKSAWRSGCWFVYRPVSTLFRRLAWWWVVGSLHFPGSLASASPHGQWEALVKGWRRDWGEAGVFLPPHLWAPWKAWLCPLHGASFHRAGPVSVAWVASVCAGWPQLLSSMIPLAALWSLSN